MAGLRIGPTCGSFGRMRRVSLFWACVFWLVGTPSKELPAAESPSSSGASTIQFPTTPLQYEHPKVLKGDIYSQAGNKRELLFHFERRAVREGNKLTVRREYTYPDGRIAARERVAYDGNELGFFELEETQTGGRGSATIRQRPGSPGRAAVDFTYQPQAGAPLKTSTEELRQNTFINDMVGVFLASHWDALARGEKLRCRYIVVPRRETVGFTFFRTSESTWQGQDVAVIRMEPTSAILGALVKPLYFTIEKRAPHRVLQYTGRTTPKLKDGAQWKDLDAVTVFDWKQAEP